MYIIIPQSEADTFSRTISRFEKIEPVELADGSFTLPSDVKDRLQELSEREDYQKMKAEYVSTIKTMLDKYEVRDTVIVKQETI